MKRMTSASVTVETPIVRFVHQILYAGVFVGSTNGHRVFAEG